MDESTQQASVIRPGDCPPWCVYEPGHDYESEARDGTLIRYHSTAERTVSGEMRNKAGRRDTVVVGIKAEETLAPDGTVRVAVPLVFLGAENVDLTARDVVKLRVALDEVLDDLVLILPAGLPDLSRS